METHNKDGQSYPGWWATTEALLYLSESWPLCQKLPPSKKYTKAPAAEGAYQNNSGSKSQSTGTNLSTRSAGFSSKGGSSVKGARKVPCWNPDPFTHLIGPKNWGEAFIDNKLSTCLLDNRAQLNFMTPDYAVKRGLQVFTLEQLAQEIGGELPPIHGIGRIKVKP